MNAGVGAVRTSVVMPVLNGAATIGAQLEPLLRQARHSDVEIVVVDNGSVDGTVALVSSLAEREPSLRLVSEARKGINRARNSGVLSARGELILLCDSDDVVGDGWLEAMEAAAVPGYWLAGTLDYLRLNSASTRRIWSAPDQSSEYDPDSLVDRTYGCNCGFFRSMWIEVGGFDDSLSGTGGDETEMFMRARAAGYRGQGVGDAIVSYRLRAGVKSLIRQRYRQGRNQVRTRRLPSGRLFPSLGGPVHLLGRICRLWLGLPIRRIRGESAWLTVSATAVTIGQFVETVLGPRPLRHSKREDATRG